MDTSSALIMLLAVLFVFLIARELMCWYWKLNKMVSLLERIDEKLDLDDKIEQIQIALDKIEGGSLRKSTAQKVMEAEK